VFQRVAPMLLVEGVERGIRFYYEVLGGRLTAVYPEQPSHEWASLKLEGVELMLWEKDAAKVEYPELESPAGTILYIYVDALYERVKEVAEVLMAPVDQFYGIREFAIRDPYGFVLTFAQEKVG